MMMLETPMDLLNTDYQQQSLERKGQLDLVVLLGLLGLLEDQPEQLVQLELMEPLELKDPLVLLELKVLLEMQ